jgi:xylulokinase
MLCNRRVNAHVHHIDFNKHTPAHMFRAAQEGIAFSFRYGLDIMRSNGMNPTVIRAGKSNMFLSNVFTQAFVNATGVPVELYSCDGSVGAAIGAGLGACIYATPQEAFQHFERMAIAEPDAQQSRYNELYQEWKALLDKHLQDVA